LPGVVLAAGDKINRGDWTPLWHVELMDPKIFDNPSESARGVFMLTDAWAHYVDSSMDR